MIVIVEGIDKVGKTDLCKRLEKLGFCYFKDAWNHECPSHELHTFSAGKLDTTLSALKLLNDAGRHVVVDRYHLTEQVYGTHSRNMAHHDYIEVIDKTLEEIGAMLVYVKPYDIAWSCREAGEDLELHDEYFKILYDRTAIRNKITVGYPNLDIAAAWIARKAAKYDFYFASPFFNPEQVEREEALKKLLRDNGFSIYSPKEACHLTPNASITERKAVFDDNLNAINQALMVFAITDGKDMGTIWEAGYAYAVKKPILYFAETLGNGNFNLMLAQSGRGVYLNREEVTPKSIFRYLMGENTDFNGVIE